MANFCVSGYWCMVVGELHWDCGSTGPLHVDTECWPAEPCHCMLGAARPAWVPGFEHTIKCTGQSEDRIPSRPTYDDWPVCIQHLPVELLEILDLHPKLLAFLPPVNHHRSARSKTSVMRVCVWPNSCGVLPCGFYHFVGASVVVVPKRPRATR
jgi:hypothetical protein